MARKYNLDFESDSDDNSLFTTQEPSQSFLVNVARNQNQGNFNLDLENLLESSKDSGNDSEVIACINAIDENSNHHL